MSAVYSASFPLAGILAQLQALRLLNSRDVSSFGPQTSAAQQAPFLAAEGIDVRGMPTSSLVRLASAPLPAAGLSFAREGPSLAQPASKRGGRRKHQHQNEAQIRRTVYITDVDSSVMEQRLAAVFAGCGSIIDCRICGERTSRTRFAFIEFATELAARAALGFNGVVLGAFAINVTPSRTAIVPVNNQFLPRSEEEREAVARTVYVTNIHKAVDQDSLVSFFENLCGPVFKVRMLGDASHQTKIAFLEFTTFAGATAALQCTGMRLGALAVRVSASKTPVRTEPNRTGSHAPVRPVTGAPSTSPSSASQSILTQLTELARAASCPADVSLNSPNMYSVQTQNATTGQIDDIESF